MAEDEEASRVLRADLDGHGRILLTIHDGPWQD
jgi:hypothetical protein